ncbi:hypothetical protein [Methanococcoides alaskense]|uniref:Uncharacterized protein n=1 Tax=Methanococcoides alaskense TaxID=325778 RepID=A0AA90Z6U8_9EURY|nr:hypothetical protein [Methanococcoides alaskense]MDA0524976.1 hypothetical protein [Methanococcoides alaskense]MDR6222109.1 hypothetical protein [Methanococcoides alaskense]
MKYTFQDSTDLPLQRDIIKDVQNFVDISRKVLPIENASIEKNDDLYRRRISLEKGVDELESINSKVLEFINGLTEDSDMKEILDYRNSVFDQCDASFNKSTKTMQFEIESINNSIEDANLGASRQILSSLNSLFEGGIYGTTDRFFASMNRGVLSGKISSTVAGMEYESELIFKDDLLTIRGVYGTLFLPTWIKSGIFYKEEKVKLEEVSDFMLTSLEFDDVRAMASFENKKSTKRFKVEMDGNSFILHYHGNEVTADPTLMQSLKSEHVIALLDTFKEHISSSIKKHTLVKLVLDGDDAIMNNQIFDCLKLIAEQFTELINECLERGYAKDEITIKIEENDGTRTEKYVSKTDLFDQLSELGSEGLELASLLGVDNI